MANSGFACFGFYKDEFGNIDVRRIRTENDGVAAAFAVRSPTRLYFLRKSKIPIELAFQDIHNDLEGDSIDLSVAGSIAIAGPVTFVRSLHELGSRIGSSFSKAELERWLVESLTNFVRGKYPAQLSLPQAEQHAFWRDALNSKLVDLGISLDPDRIAEQSEAKENRRHDEIERKQRIQVSTDTLIRKQIEKRRRSLTFAPLIAAATVAIAAVAVGAGLWFAQPNAGDSDCSAFTSSGASVILVDNRAEWGEAAKEEVSRALGDLARVLSDHHLLELRQFDPTVNGGRVLFSRCNPGSGAEGAERALWVAEFEQSLQTLIESSPAATRSEHSPLMATVQSIAQDRFISRPTTGSSHQLVLVSDMIEDTPTYAQDGQIDITMDGFRSTGAYQPDFVDLSRVSVSIIYLEAETLPFEIRGHIQFWADWVREYRGTIEAKRVRLF